MVHTQPLVSAFLKDPPHWESRQLKRRLKTTACQTSLGRLKMLVIMRQPSITSNEQVTLGIINHWWLSLLPINIIIIMFNNHRHSEPFSATIEQEIGITDHYTPVNSTISPLYTTILTLSPCWPAAVCCCLPWSPSGSVASSSSALPTPGPDNDDTRWSYRAKKKVS